MRLKMPIFMALIVGPLLAIIFVIWPDFQKIGPQKETLKAKEELVNSIRQKNNNISSLTESLNSVQNSAQKKFVLDYIPLEKKEEKIFNSISAIADAEGVKVALSNISLQISKDEVKSVVEEPIVPAYPIAGPGQEAAMNIAPTSVLPAARTIKAEITTVGSYESQKNFIAKLYALDMMKNIASLDLSKASSGEGGSGDILNGTLSAEFSFIPKAEIGKDYNNPIFSRSSFNFESVEKMTRLLSQKAAEVTVDGSGRSNPFLP